jgi:hypothetical protein
MLNKMKAAAVVTTFLGVVLSVLNVQAIPLNGAFSEAGNLVPVNGTTGTVVGLNVATGLDFISLLGGTTPTPGVPGQFFVTSGTGDFAFLGSLTGLIKDFTFAGAGSANYPNVPILSFKTASTVTFDLLTISVVSQGTDINNNQFLQLAGTGVFHEAGFDATAGTFILTANQAGTTFSYSASEISQGTPIPEPATLSLVGLGLAAAGLAGRRRKPVK